MQPSFLVLRCKQYNLSLDTENDIIYDDNDEEYYEWGDDDD